MVWVMFGQDGACPAVGWAVPAARDVDECGWDVFGAGIIGAVGGGEGAVGEEPEGVFGAGFAGGLCCP